MGISDWKHWLIILIVVIIVFGTKKLKNLGSDLGGAIKGFRQSMADEEGALSRVAVADSSPAIKAAIVKKPVKEAPVKKIVTAKKVASKKAVKKSIVKKPVVKSTVASKKTKAAE